MEDKEAKPKIRKVVPVPQFLREGAFMLERCEIKLQSYAIVSENNSALLLCGENLTLVRTAVSSVELLCYFPLTGAFRKLTITLQLGVLRLSDRAPRVRVIPWPQIFILQCQMA